MNTEPSTSPDWSSTTARAAEKAQRLRPWALFLWTFLVLGIALSDLLEPLLEALRSLESGEAQSLWKRLQWLSIEWTRAAPALVLAYAVWLGQGYLAQLAGGQVWQQHTAPLLRQVGQCVVWSALLHALIVPNVLRWASQQGGFEFMLDSLTLVLAGLGGLLVLISWVLHDVLRTAQGLKAETDSFV